MGKEKPKCKECGEIIKLTKKDKALLKGIKMAAGSLKMLGSAYKPIIEAINTGVGKDLCANCYRTKVEDGARTAGFSRNKLPEELD